MEYKKVPGTEKMKTKCKPCCASEFNKLSPDEIDQLIYRQENKMKRFDMKIFDCQFDLNFTFFAVALDQNKNSYKRYTVFTSIELLYQGTLN